jgi:glycosyltransferase involved in cell wall biosynthesis
VVPPKNPGELALAIAEALALDDEAFDALAARAREFADFVFAPDRAAGATLGVYSALLAGER